MKFELNCASALFVLGRSGERPYRIRFALRLRERVDEAALQAALDAAVRRYPAFCVRFIRGFSRLYGETAGCAPRVTRAGGNPYRQLYDVQVQVRDDTMILEYSHFITDGRGGLQFLVYLAAEYLSRTHPGTNFPDAIPVPTLEQQLENGYRAHGKGLRGNRRRGRAWLFRGTPLGCAAVPKVNTYRLSAPEVHRQAKAHQTTVTGYMAALLITAIGGVWREQGPRPGKLRLSVPVDLRPRFSCPTMGNFSLNVYPEADPARDEMTLPALCDRFRRYMADATGTDRLAGRCALAERLGNGALVRALPFSWKQKLVRAALDHAAGSTMTFSNLGVVRLPEGMEAHVAGLELAFSPKPDAPYSCSMLTLGEDLRLTLVRTIQEPLLEQHLEAAFRAQGLAFSRNFTSQPTGAEQTRSDFHG